MNAKRYEITELDIWESAKPCLWSKMEFFKWALQYHTPSKEVQWKYGEKGIKYFRSTAILLTGKYQTEEDQNFLMK